MKYLGIDYGTKKVGLALSDENASVAFPKTVVANDKSLLSAVEDVLEDEHATEIVMGHSVSMGGQENPVMEYAYKFKEQLEEKGYTVHLEPEFLTTVQARRESDNDMADAAAAALILQTFLDKQS